MILGIYADPHISYTSSILPLTSEGKYTCRLDMIINSFRWMYEEFKKNKVDLICNCGDTFDSHVVKAEEITALSECLSYSKGTPEIWITGNHEMFNSQFYSNSFVDNYEFINLYEDMQKVNDVISVIPYRKASEIDVGKLSEISNEVVISHIDLKGSHLRPDFTMDDGIDPELLALYFKASFNGHIHTAEKFDTADNFVANVGSLVGISFSDSNYYVPNIVIYNTDTGKFKRIQNPYAILFRKIECDSITDLLNKISKLNKKFRHALRITCPYSIKDEVKDIIDKEKFIITSRVIASVDNSSSGIQYSVKNVVTLSDSAIKCKFSEFLKSNSDLLKYPADMYTRILSDLR